METTAKIVEITLPADFGSTGVRVSRIIPMAANGVHVLLLHGVFSTANLESNNKFNRIARLLAEKGFSPWLCETSRHSSLHDKITEKLAWLMDAFNGKTCRNEIDDCKTALSLMLKDVPHKFWIWGFSLGGIIALKLAEESGLLVDKIILSGTGLVSTPEAEKNMMPLPILSTLRETVSEKFIEKIKVNELISFHGSNDNIFTEAACRNLLAKVPAAKKKFIEIIGADHSFKIREGRHDTAILDEMITTVTVDNA